MPHPLQRMSAWLAAASVLAAVAWAMREARPARPGVVGPDAVPAARSAARPRAGTNPSAPAEDPTSRRAFRATVRTETGIPVSGAVVVCEPVRRNEGDAAPPAVAPGRTGADGRATLQGVGAGWWRISATADGFARTSAVAPRTDRDPPQEVELILSPASVVEVRVRRADGSSAAGCQVESSWQGRSGVCTFEARTDERGVARLSVIARGLVIVSAADGDRRDTAFVTTPEVVRADLRIPAPEVPREPEMRSVRVLDPGGAPIADARICAVRDGCESVLATTGAEGIAQFPIDGISSFDAFSIRCAGRALAAVPADGVMRRRPEVPLDVVLRPEGAVAGIVVGPDGPVAGAIVRVWMDAADLPLRFPLHSDAATTDATGAWRIGGLPAGAAFVEADAPGFAQPGWGPDERFVLQQGSPLFDIADTPPTAKVTVSEGGTARHDPVLVRHEPAAPYRVTISGRVERADGRPVPWAPVLVQGRRGRWSVELASGLSAADGTFVVEADGTHCMSVSSSPAGFDLRSSSVEILPVAGAARDVRIVVEDLPVVRGRVLDEDGSPVPGARVRLGGMVASKWGVEGGRWFSVSRAVTSADGGFEIPVEGHFDDFRWTTGWFALCAEAEFPAAVVSAPFRVESDTDEPPPSIPFIELTLTRAAIDGRIVDDEGRPVADVPVLLCGTRPPWPPTDAPRPEFSSLARTAADGSFRLDRLPPGTREFAVHAPGCVAERWSLTAPSRAVELRVRRAMRVVGRVLRPDGSPHADRIVRIASPGSGREPIVLGTDDSGAFSAEGVPFGPSRIVVAAEDEDPVRTAEFDVVADGREILLTIPVPATLRGAVRDARGSPVPSARVRFDRDRGLDGDPHLDDEVECGADGRFVLREMTAGRHRFDLRSHSLRFVGVPVPGDAELRVPGELEIAGVIEAAEELGDGVVLAARRVGATDGAGGVEVVHVAAAHRVGGVQRFRFTGLAAGEHEIKLDPDSEIRGQSAFLADPVRAEAGSAGVVVRISVR